MGYPIARSMNADLAEGATDGKYKKVIQDRGGVVERSFVGTRQPLNDRYFGIHETPQKISPDGQPTSTPNFVPTAPAHLD